MTTTKLNPFDRYDNSDICHMQAVYLDAHGFAADEISTYTGYAISTVKNYIRKFGHLLDEAKALFVRISQRVKREIWGPRELAYLFKFYDKDNNLVCSKVGTTTRTIAIRLDEELKAVLGEFYEPFISARRDQQRNRLQARFPYSVSTK